MHYSHRQITEGSQLPLCTLARLHGCLCSAPAEPLREPKICSTRDPKPQAVGDHVTEFRQKEFTVSLCLHGYFVCSFLFPTRGWGVGWGGGAVNKSQSKASGVTSAETTTTRRINAKGCMVQMGFTQTDSITYLTPSALACYVTYMTGYKT